MSKASAETSPPRILPPQRKTQWKPPPCEWKLRDRHGGESQNASARVCRFRESSTAKISKIDFSEKSKAEDLIYYRANINITHGC